MNKYTVMEINAPVFNDCPIVEAKNASEAVFKAFGVKAKRSGDEYLHYRTQNHNNGRMTYLKRLEE